MDRYNTYKCEKKKRCVIDVISRRNCQYCRFQKCLKSGMRTKWVLTEEEKLERNIKKRVNAAKRKMDRQNMKTVNLTGN